MVASAVQDLRSISWLFIGCRVFITCRVVDRPAQPLFLATGRWQAIMVDQALLHYEVELRRMLTFIDRVFARMKTIKDAPRTPIRCGLA